MAAPPTPTPTAERIATFWKYAAEHLGTVKPRDIIRDLDTLEKHVDKPLEQYASLLTPSGVIYRKLSALFEAISPDISFYIRPRAIDTSRLPAPLLERIQAKFPGVAKIMPVRNELVLHTTYDYRQLPLVEQVYAAAPHIDDEWTVIRYLPALWESKVGQPVGIMVSSFNSEQFFASALDDGTIDLVFVTRRALDTQDKIDDLYHSLLKLVSAIVGEYHAANTIKRVTLIPYAIYATRTALPELTDLSALPTQLQSLLPTSKSCGFCNISAIHANLSTVTLPGSLLEVSLCAWCANCMNINC